MLFNSFKFLIFFPIVTFIYFVIPFKQRWKWLLVASYYFYMNWNPRYALLMGFSTLITFLSGYLIEREEENKSLNEKEKIKRKKMWVFLSFFINLSILFFFKYFNFFGRSITKVLFLLHIGIKIPNLDVLLPVGISFYTFQALSYTMDVYKGNIKAQKHLGKYALFVSFFPQLVAGPIERSTHLLPQFNQEFKFNYERMKEGLLLMLWGLFKKIVIADRLAILVNTVYNNPKNYTGVPLLIATIFFAFQIYCDFSSYSDIAIGAAKVMGYDLMKNFNRPYFSKSIGEFWRRWHISLGTWFKDYLYFPLGGSRVSKLKKYRNIMIVFLTSGLWHGASINFVIWGALHGLYQLIESELRPVGDFIVKVFKVNKKTYGYKFFKILITFILVDFAWIFFRANNFNDAKYIIKNIFKINILDFFNGTLYKLGLDQKDFEFSIKLIIFLAVISYIQRKKDIIVRINNENLITRWSIYFIGIFSILIFGIYGNKYVASQFIYFQF